jgi:hypothetical protein
LAPLRGMASWRVHCWRNSQRQVRLLYTNS